MPSQPNIVIVTLHDTGRHFGCYGRGVSTPAIDALASEGVIYENAFTTSPVCSPARGAIMTGRYPQANGLMGLVHAPWWWELNDEEQHLSQLLQARGYRTRLFGFQHEAPSADRLGFDEAVQLGKPGGGSRNAVEIAECFTHALPDMVDDDRPFFAQIGFFETHTPYDDGRITADDPESVTVPDFVVATPEARKHVAELQGAVKQADEALGHIENALAQCGQRNNTLIVFTVDHGVELGRRAKWTCYEPGLEVALLMRWPNGGLNAGRRVRGLVSTVDVAPTIMDAVEGRIPDTMQAPSLLPVAKGETDHTPHEEIYAMFVNAPEPRCIRTERFKLIRNFGASRLPRTPARIGDSSSTWTTTPFIQLFDLDNDPLEIDNLADSGAFKAVREELDAKLLHWMREVGDPILEGPVPSQYYERAIQDFLG